MVAADLHLSDQSSHALHKIISEMTLYADETKRCVCGYGVVFLLH